jgi:alpha-L-fucosidase 2
VIRLLPALPAEWRDGAVQGLRARGGIDVDLTWADGRATQAEVRAHVTRPCRVQAKGRITVTSDGRPVHVVRRGPETIEFAVAAGRSYRLAFSKDP